MKLETIVIPVSDVDRAKAFYEGLGWRLDADIAGGDLRFVQFTPPGSGCSIQFGTGLTSAAPGTAECLLVVSDIEAAHDELVDRRGRRRARSSTTPTAATTASTPTAGRAAPIRNGAPTPRSWSSATRTETSGSCRRSRAGCPAGSTRRRPTYSSVADVASALRRAAAAHGEHEARIGQADENWPDWYAAYMVAEQSGAELPQ